jgi:hypothetical protein
MFDRRNEARIGAAGHIQERNINLTIKTEKMLSLFIIIAMPHPMWFLPIVIFYYILLKIIKYIRK